MLNQCTFIGRLTSDPDFKVVGEGVPLTRFSIAVERAYVKEGEEREVDYPQIVVWRKLAEHCANYLQKGSMVAVVGRYQTRSWEDEESGDRRKAHEFIADNVRFLAKTKRQDDAVKQDDDGDDDSL